ncbi:hypothetical protein [Collimonas arenae]|uniref:hypothetical protein n=1 Tax=Collimonas arenae TaxID=279058 RepID=UPI000FE140CE|nr:hypothetical protein [Collimonas arenae]
MPAKAPSAKRLGLFLFRRDVELRLAFANCDMRRAEFWGVPGMLGQLAYSQSLCYLPPKKTAINSLRRVAATHQSGPLSAIDSGYILLSFRFGLLCVPNDFSLRRISNPASSCRHWQCLLRFFARLSSPFWCLACTKVVLLKNYQFELDCIDF